MKLELVSRDEVIASDTTKIEFRLKILDPKKRSNKYKENEAIQFDFDMETDNAEEVAKDMVFTIYKYCLNQKFSRIML